METEDKETKIIMEFINSYNECFYKKDLEKLKTFYDFVTPALMAGNHDDLPAFLWAECTPTEQYKRRFELRTCGTMVRISSVMPK